MTKKNIRILAILYLLINSISFLLSFNGVIGQYGSFNILFSLLFANIVRNNYLFSSLIYLAVTTLITYGLAESARRKIEIVILVVLLLGISIPYLDLNGL
ncbi:hypothetical protein CJ739_3875 [Mariniflexile rhizosphaerae]|nr:hypothetical protein CJ739_3875 [Mariniflexile sp. TRM1-10]